MSDISDYLKQVLDKDDKPLFEEACNSAKAGALRAAYIMVWLCCAESLKRRFRVAQARDGQAKRVCGDVDRREKAHQSVDMYLLDEAHKYGFISDTERTQLEHIYNMRCIYGHPYEKAPNKIELEAAANKVVELVLSKPVRLRHGFLDSQALLITTNKNYLDDDTTAVQEYTNEMIARADPELLEWWITKILDGVESIKADPNMGIFVRRGVFIVQGVIDSLTKDNVSAWNVEELLLKYADHTPRLFASANVFHNLSAKNQDMIVGMLLESADTKPRGLFRIFSLDQKKMLSVRHQERFQKRISEIKLESMVKAGLPLGMFAARIIEDLKSHNWYVQNPAILTIQNAGKAQVGALDASIKFLLGNNVLQAADGGATKAVEFMKSIADEKDWPIEFIGGLIVECFINEKNALRFKTDQLSKAIQCVLARNKAEGTAILEDLIKKIKAGAPRNTWSWDADKTEVIKVLTEFQNDDAIRQLIETINSIVVVPETFP